MPRKLSLILMTVLLCIAPFCALAADASDPVVVAVGQFEYPLSVVQASLDGTKSLYDVYGMALTDEQAKQLIQGVAERFVLMGVMENKLRELGLDTLTADERQALNEAARVRYEEIWQELASQIREVDPSVSDADITAFLTSQSVTLDALYDEALAAVKSRRMTDRFCTDVTVTDGQVATFYDEQYVTPFRERYMDDIPLYENEILAAGNESFYRPEGYRRIKQILLPVPDELTLRLDDIESRMGTAEASAQTAYEELAALAAKGEDPEKAREDYNAALKQYDSLEVEYLSVRGQILPAVSETTDAIYSALEAGEPFEALMSKYSVDTQQSPLAPGYLFHSDSQMWAAAFHDAAAMLSSVGDVSRPFLTGSGVHILLYASDEPYGPHALSSEEAALIKETALQSARNKALEGMLTVWRDEYEITMNVQLLTVTH